ncbi:hypothetical protein A3739_22265 [Oleiphilus sp. HI0067]|nr:hypothetical protein A3739_22265 [Oleiphilus sp. HI0067]
MALLAGWRRTKSFTNFINAANVFLMSLGILLLLQQLHGYSHEQHPDDFGFSADNHLHAHEEMDASSMKVPAKTHHDSID